MSQEENQQEYSSAQGKSVSQWPKYFPVDKTGSIRKRQRTLAYLTPLYNEKEETIGYTCRDEHGIRNNCYTSQQLIEYIIDNNIDVYITKLYGRNGSFAWLSDWLARADVTGYIAQSSKSLITLSISSGRRKYKIINASNWQAGIVPNDDFLIALRNLFTAYGYGTYASPSSLGHAALQASMYYQKTGKIYRPGEGLRDRIARYSSGGRADDFTLAQQYKKAYEIDRNNSYAVSASEGVASGRIGERFTIGLEDVYENTLFEVSKWQNTGTSFCQAEIGIPDMGTRKLSPFYTRTDSGLLEWQTKPGTYYGYYWYPMLARCEAIGYRVRLGKCYIWTELDRFMSSWVHDLVKLRYHFRQQGLKLEEQLTKGIIVASIGRFGMSNDTLTLVTKEQAKPDDEKWLNLQAQDGESLDTPYFMHKETDNDSNHLTQIASQIICMNNLALYDEMVMQEELGNTVYASNFDAFFAEQPYIGELQGWKQKEHNKWTPYGKRSYESVVNGTKVRKRPGVKQDDTR